MTKPNVTRKGRNLCSGPHGCGHRELNHDLHGYCDLCETGPCARSQERAPDGSILEDQIMP